MKRDFLPLKMSKVDSWEQQFSTQLDNHAAHLGISAAQVTAMQQQIEAHRTAYKEAQAAKITAKSKVAAMITQQAITLKAVRKMVRIIKASPTYAGSIGESMGIVGPEDSRELRPPVLKIRSIGGRTVISYKKYRSQGIFIYSKRGTEPHLTLLAVDSRSPYVDTRPNLNPNEPEQRHYAAYYMINDEPVGQMSNATAVLVAAEGY
jgi:cell division protein FtsB